MSCWLLSIVHVISTCTATEILYVLPDNVSDVNCPSQPCATLGQYLLDNGSLPVLSDVEYHFLPGEHHVVNSINIHDALNLSLIGFGLLPAKLICRPQSHVSMVFSYNATIRNLVFNQCSKDLVQYGLFAAGGLILYECSHCKVEDTIFFGYGFVGINFLNSSVTNITINITIEMITVLIPTINMCSPRFYMSNNDVEDNYVLINQLSISGYISEFCPDYLFVMEIYVNNSYDMQVEICNLQIYNVTQSAFYIRTENTSGSLLIKNCTFTYVGRESVLLYTLFVNEIPNNNVSIIVENCAFYYNVAINILMLWFNNYLDEWCTHSSNIKIENCDFIGNTGKLIHSYADHCTTNVFLKDVNFAKNKADILIGFINIVVEINGTVTFLENEVREEIMKFESCEISCTKTITFISNICKTIIHMMSFYKQYIKLMEHANITWINNTYHDLILTGPVYIGYIGMFPYCFFQFMALANDKPNVTETLAHYTISLSGNKQFQTISMSNYDSATLLNNIYVSINGLLTHCKWLHKGSFNGYSPGYINQHIIQVDGHQWIHHKEICYCPHDGPYDCTVDQLGPVYPGQVLQIELCMPQAVLDENILHVETHSASLPKTACKIAHQTELISSIRSHSEIFNFTIISEIELCELFITVQPFVRSAFYVQLLPCPFGFTLQNGTCDCDPFLPPDIDTCYIDLSAIRRPANIWITAHTLTNNITNYLISDCPMDYCLPYSTNVNLVHPDLQCQFNRTGILCSQCPHPLSMVFASSRCMKCTNVHILITIIVIVAGIVLVVLLYVLNLTVTNGTINGIIFYANIVSINDSVFLVNDNVFKPLRVFISFTNLDLGIETCFYNGMDSYIKMWLQLFFPSYLIINAILIILASRYSSRVLRLTYRRSLPVLATLFLLSYTGVLRVVLTVLFSYSTITHYPSGNKQTVWSINASVPLFGFKFIILFITCLVLFLILFLFSIALLFTRFLSRFRIVNRLKPLLDPFQGSYKDKYYYWIAVHIILRSIFFLLYVFSISLRLIISTIILVVFTVCYGYLQPNKNKLINIQELSLLTNLAIMHAVSFQHDANIFSVITNLMIGLAIMQFVIIILCHFVTYTIHQDIAIKQKLINLVTVKRKSECSYDVALLNIPERTYNYNEYQDGLVSEDFI